MGDKQANFVLRIFSRPEIFIYIAFFVFTAIFFILNSSLENGGKGIIAHYAKLNGPRTVWTAILFFGALFAHGVVLWARAAIKQIDPATIFTRENLIRFIQRIRAVLKDLAFVGIPFALAFYSLSMAIGPLNAFNATRLRDELLLKWDLFLTGTFPPLTAASLEYPGWFVSAVDFSFFHLVPALTIFGAYLFIARQQLFREAAGAFFLGLMILYAGWLTFPVLSPHDRFIDNIYELPTVEAVQTYLANYQPQKEIAAFLEGIRERKEGLSALPTSTFPSAHVAWGVLLAYYAWRLWPWLGLVALPFAILSSIGTFLFAQHYFVDLPAGILASALSIWMAHWLVKKQDKLRSFSAKRILSEA